MSARIGDAMASLSAADASMPDLVGALGWVRAAMVDLEAAQEAVVSALRAEGFTWAEVGDVLDCSRQYAHKRFGP